MAEEVEAERLLEQMNALEQELLVNRLAVQLRERQKQIEQINTTLYHYASADAFGKIIENQTIWMTNAAYVNDQGELSYPVSLALELLQEHWNAAPENELRRFLAGLAKTLQSHVEFKNWHVASFSAEGDLLSQWRAYCPSGGYSIGLNGATLATAMPDRIRTRVGPNTQIGKIRDILNEQIEIWKTVRGKHSALSQADYDRSIAVSTVFALTYEFVFFKAPAFVEEREWRMAQRYQPQDTAVIS